MAPHAWSMYFRRGGRVDRTMFADFADGQTVTEIRHHTLKKFMHALSPPSGS
jgi:hypothetical protein